MVDGTFPDTGFTSWPTWFRHNKAAKIVDFNVMWDTSDQRQGFVLSVNLGDSSRLAWDCSARSRHWVCLHFHKTTHFPHFSPAPMSAWSCLFTILQCWGVHTGRWLIWAFVYSGTKWHQALYHISLFQGEWASVAMPNSFVQLPLPCPHRPLSFGYFCIFVTLHERIKKRIDG